MSVSKYMLRIVLLFIIGIVIQEYAQFNSFLVLSFWLGILILLLVISIEKSSSYRFQKLISIQLYMLFLIGGMLALGSSSPGFYKNHFEKHLLPQDQIIVRVAEFSSGQNNYDKAIFEVTQVVSSASFKNVEGKILAYVEKGEKQLVRGEIIVLEPNFIAIENKGNPGEFDAHRFWKSKGITKMLFVKNSEYLTINGLNTSEPFFDKLRSYLKNELEKWLSPDASSLAIALSLGDKSGLSQETRENFSNAGAMHVLAVSGLHVGILLGIVQWIFFQVKLLRRRNTYVLCAIVILWFFALLTGLAPSVFRATVMFSVLGFGQLLGKRFFSLNALLVSALILLMLDAKVLFDIGFQLSYLALLGISFFFQPLSKLLNFKHKWLHKLWEGTALGLAAQIGTIPISLYYFHQFPNYFILTNLGLILISGIALGSVLLFFVISQVPFLNYLVAQGLEIIFVSMKWFVKTIDQLPYSVARGFSLDLWHVLITYAVVAFLVFTYHTQKIKWWYAALLVCFLSATSLVYIRQTSELKSETVVFNTSSPLILLKTGGKNYFFHSTEDQEELLRLTYIVSAYEKKFGGLSSYHLIEENKLLAVKKDSKTIVAIENKSNTLHITTKEKSFLMPLETDYINFYNEPVIAGSWLKRVDETQNSLDLTKGALKL